MATTQPEYNSIATEYAEVKETNFRKPVEHYTIDNIMLRPILDDQGLLTGKRVLDLACGHGYYTRRLKTLNCAYILGVDISSSMVELAREIESKNSQHIEYMVADAKHLPSPEQPYDLVTGFYLLNHAASRSELLDMARVIYAQLGEKKCFVGITANVAAGEAAFDKRKYGIVKQCKATLDSDTIPDGTEVLVTLHNSQGKPTCTFTDYHYSPTTYEQVFKEAGFSEFRWIPFQCNPDIPDPAFFDEYISCAPSIGVMAIK